MKKVKFTLPELKAKSYVTNLPKGRIKGGALAATCWTCCATTKEEG